MIKTKIKFFLKNADKAAVSYTSHSLKAVIFLCLVLILYISKLADCNDLSFFSLFERAHYILESALCSLFIAVGFGILADKIIKHDNLRENSRR